MQARVRRRSSEHAIRADSRCALRPSLGLPPAPAARPCVHPGSAPSSPRSGALLLAALREERAHLGAARPAWQQGRTSGAARVGQPQVRGSALRTFLRKTRLRARRLLSGARLPVQVGFGSLLVYLVLFNFSVVRGSSMSPGIRDGDRILIDQLSYFFRDVQRGDVIVMRYPLDPSVDYIKRIVGLPGDQVVIRGAQVFVNGELLSEPYVNESDARSYLSTRVAPGHYFVLGDNRPHSADSREFGQVPHAFVRGKVDLRIWPIARLGLIE